MTTSNIIAEEGLGNILKSTEVKDRGNQKNEFSSNRFRLKNKIESEKKGKDFIIDKTGFQLSKIQASYTDINSVATSIRKTDKEMKAVEENIDRMRQEIEVIVKRFPPFPPGSDERIRHLKNYDAYRKLIENLTFPKDRANEPDDNGIDSREGETVPALSEHASDQEVSEAFEFLEKAGNKVRNIRKELYEATESLLRQKNA